MIVRLLFAFGGALFALIGLPVSVHAGFCPDLPNCAGGDPGLTSACAAGIGLVAAACLPRGQGGAWVDPTDDFGDTDGTDDDANDDDNEAGGQTDDLAPPTGPAS